MNIVMQMVNRLLLGKNGFFNYIANGNNSHEIFFFKNRQVPDVIFCKKFHTKINRIIWF